MLKLFTWIFLLQLEYKLRILEFSAKYYDLTIIILFHHI